MKHQILTKIIEIHNRKVTNKIVPNHVLIRELEAEINQEHKRDYNDKMRVCLNELWKVGLIKVGTAMQCHYVLPINQ